jgi:hypothetical protein
MQVALTAATSNHQQHTSYNVDLSALSEDCTPQLPSKAQCAHFPSKMDSAAFSPTM